LNAALVLVTLNQICKYMGIMFNNPLGFAGARVIDGNEVSVCQFISTVCW
jgi:hypothetical protein